MHERVSFKGIFNLFDHVKKISDTTKSIQEANETHERTDKAILEELTNLHEQFKSKDQ